MKKPNNDSAALKIFERQQDEIIKRIERIEALMKANHAELVERLDSRGYHGNRFSQFKALKPKTLVPADAVRSAAEMLMSLTAKEEQQAVPPGMLILREASADKSNQDESSRDESDENDAKS